MSSDREKSRAQLRAEGKIATLAEVFEVERQEWADLEAERDRLRAENEMLRLAFCDEAYIVAVQTLDVKALGKGRREILTAQAVRMFKVGLNEGQPRSSRNTDASLVARAREKLAELSGDAS